MTEWAQLGDAQMGALITALGAVVEPTGIDLVVGVRTAIDSKTPGLRRVERRSSRAVAAALILLAGVLTFSIAPTRSALAGWLGIGSTSVVTVDELPPAEPPTQPTAPPIEPATPSTAPRFQPAPPPTDEGRGSGSIRRAAAEQLDISVRLPDPELVGAVGGWEIRATGEGEELVVAWDRVTLTARARSVGAPQQKLVTAFDVVSAAVLADGTPALWIEGVHIRVAGDVVESVGSTLLWEANGIEYRIFGELVQSEVIEIASSLE